ncbi:LLM class flavin-dependent oxidoreductase [Burkholderia stabilis]|uniref:LLM class flavin-dependent oxidoreductase n=1 Tax=Burkholderia stabilis TaxID=95485 RepID=UPI00158EF4AB|nr:LLM class flavin-dependent oxidoreductase [Burkholderia stabilis]
MTVERKLRIGVFLMANGHHIEAWRHPDANPDLDVSFPQYKALAQQAEAAKLDLIFLADGAAVYGDLDNHEALSRFGSHVLLEPLTLHAALSAVTERIGFVATASTSFNEPYNIARKFASLDHLSAGRVGWNVVTSASDVEARNFGLDRHLEHGHRYRRAEEFVDVVTKLWDSWEDDAFIRDKASGRYFDPTKLHPANHEGEFFSVAGALNVARSPQGYPVIVQAGSSEPGQDLAARTAEVIFTAWPTLQEAQAFYAGVKGRMAKYGRSPDQLLVMPGIFPVVGATQEEAEHKYRILQDLVQPVHAHQMLSAIAGGIDTSGIDIDGPLPPDLPADTNGSKSRLALLRALAEREKLSIRQLFLRVAGARGHLTVVGTPESIADVMEQWFREGAADGFNVMPPYLPGGLEDFINDVLPELRRRNLFRTEYEGHTLRENLGLSRPESRFASVRRVESA